MNSQSLVAIWNMIWELVGNIRVPSGKTPSQLRTDPEIQMSLINSSRSHLEHEYFNFIQETVNSNLRDANRGAMPGTEQLIRSFLQVRKVCCILKGDNLSFFSTIIKLRKMGTSGQWSTIAYAADRQRYFPKSSWILAVFRRQLKSPAKTRKSSVNSCQASSTGSSLLTDFSDRIKSRRSRSNSDDLFAPVPTLSSEQCSVLLANATLTFMRMLSRRLMITYGWNWAKLLLER